MSDKIQIETQLRQWASRKLTEDLGREVGPNDFGVIYLGQMDGDLHILTEFDNDDMFQVKYLGDVVSDLAALIAEVTL